MKRFYGVYDELMTPNEEINKALENLDGLDIVHYPDPRLRRIAEPIEIIDAAVFDLADWMLDNMFKSRGVGLAAPQLGLNIRLFVTSPSFEEEDRRVYINPELLSREGSQTDEEGCLSVPGISAKVKRPNIIRIRAINRKGEVVEDILEGWEARVFQHEFDHLEGTLFVDRLGSLGKLAIRSSLHELEEKFEEN